MVFKARGKAPEKTNKYYISDECGGLNECILIDDTLCLQNCVGFCWGRAYEAMGARPKLSRGNAENWYTYNDGYERSKTPRLGSIACWRKGEAYNENDGYGHVSVVEAIKSDGTIITSNSAYGGEYFYLEELKPPYSMGKDYVFLGFIHLPVNFTTKPVNTPAKTHTYKEGCYRVIDGPLNVRTGAGTEHRRLSFEELTENAKKQIIELAGWECNGYPEGVECDVYRIEGNWGKTPSGWICLDYCEMIDD